MPRGIKIPRTALWAELNLTRKKPRKKALGIPGKWLKSNPESRFPVERHTGNLLLGLLLSYFPGTPQSLLSGFLSSEI